MIQGGCLCGAVRFEFSGYLEGIRMCHCSVCRRISGAGNTATLLARCDGFRWLSGEAGIRTFSKPTGLSISFCEVCGSPVPDVDPRGAVNPVPAGTLDPDLNVSVLRHIYVGSRASWETLGGTAPCWDEDSPD